MSELNNPLPGTLLSTTEVSPEQMVHEIRVAMLPLQHAEHLDNFADNFGAGWLDPQSKQLRLQLHLVTIFSNAKIDELWLVVPSEVKKIALSPTCIASPGVGQRYPELPWSAQSRFILDELIELPDWTASSTKFELMAGVAGKQKKIGVISVTEESIIPNEQYAGDIEPMVLPETTASSVTVNKTLNSEVATARSSALKALAVERKVFTTYSKVISKRVKRMDRLFLFTVALPTLISIIYFGLIASDVYISESRFVLRSPQHQVGTGLGALFQGAGFSRSQDDTYSVHDYIFSRDALKQLDTELALSKEFSASHVDVFSRFGSFGWDHSFEALYRYYQKRVVLDLDSSSSISTLGVSAYTPEMAFQMNEKLLVMGENLVNQLNERGRQDMIRFASDEVAEAEKKAKLASLAVSNFRNVKGVFDPEKQSALQLQQVSKLQDELIATKIQLAQIRGLTRDNPQIASMQRRIETLQSEIKSETAKVAGGDRSLANKSTEYESLILERGFAEKQLAAALTSMEQARNEAQRKQLYLERIVQPSKADMAMEPRRIRNVFATFVLGLIAWGILTMLLAGIREHQD